MTLASPAVALTVSDDAKSGAWYTFVTLLGLTLFAFVDRQIMTLVAVPMAAELHLSDAQLGTVLGLAFAIFTVCASYPIAWLADRFGRRIVLCACVAIWSLGTAACGLAHSFGQLFGAAVAIAAGEAGLGPIAMAIVPDLFSGRKLLLANSLNYIFAYVGITVGLSLGGLAVTQLDEIHATLPIFWQQFSSWRLAFFLVSLPAPLFILLIAFARVEGEKSVTAGPQGNARILPFLQMHARAVSLVFSGISAYLLAFGGFIVWLPALNTRLFATTAAANGVGLGLAVAIGTFIGVSLGTALCRILTRRMSLGEAAAVRVCWIVMAAMTPIFFGFPYVTAAWQTFSLFGALMISGTAVGCLVPTMLQKMATPAIRARFIALYVIASGLIGGSAPTVSGWVSTALGGTPRDLALALTVVAVPCWLLGIFLFRAAERPFAALVTEIANGGVKMPSPHPLTKVESVS